MFRKYLLIKKGDLLMKKFDYEKVQNIIGYEFNNGKTLKQAFFRSSFAHENNRESNEVLEFVGDRVLDLAVVRIMLEKYGKVSDDEYFKTSKQEGEFTSIKSGLVDSNNLSKAIDRLGLEQFIYYGKSDINNNSIGVMSAKEDLFEAIIGAIAIDSNWNMSKVIKIVKNLLQTDKYLKEYESGTNYTGMLQEKTAKLGLGNPMYALNEYRENDCMMWRAILNVDGIKPTVYGYGYKQKEAKKDAAKEMLAMINNLEKKGKFKKKQTTRDTVFADLNYLIQRGAIDKPEYEFEEDYDDDGNPIWECRAHTHDLGYVYFGNGTSKKEAQAEAIAGILKDIH